jgi:hypothetical protein
MSTEHVRTTADLVRFGCGLQVECCHCGTSGTFDAAEAVTDAGHVELRWLARRFRCLRCGLKRARLTVLPPV